MRPPTRRIPYVAAPSAAMVGYGAQGAGAGAPRAFGAGVVPPSRSEGMFYSVWDPMRRVYTYYETPRPDTTNPDPRHLPGRATSGAAGNLGVASTAAGWPLPADAVKRGEGPLPRGMVALGSSDTKVLGGHLIPLGLGMIAYGLWKLFGNPRRPTRRTR